MNRTFIFDLDDTLIESQAHYCEIKYSLWKFMRERFGFRGPELHRTVVKLDEIDGDMSRKHGFGMDRFPLAVKTTFDYFAEQLEIKDEKGSELAKELGYAVFESSKYAEFGFLPGVEETLDFLVEKGCNLSILTKGDSRVQQPKIDGTNCKKWFGNRIHVVERAKTPEKMLEIVNGNKNAMMVGNSYESDMLPALNAGMNAIYIPFENKVFENKHIVVLESDKMKIFKQFIEIKEKYHLL